MNAIVVEWTGPYRREEAGIQKGAGLYLCWGRHRLGSGGAEQTRYIGISEHHHGVGMRIRDHEGREFDHPDNEWWIGRVINQYPRGRQDLEEAEWLLVRFVQSVENIAKSRSDPPASLSLINEWIHASTGDAVLRARGAAYEVADVVVWDATRKRVRWAPRLKVLQSDT